jgi:hypothetical protein
MALTTDFLIRGASWEASLLVPDRFRDFCVRARKLPDPRTPSTSLVFVFPASSLIKLRTLSEGIK